MTRAGKSKKRPGQTAGLCRDRVLSVAVELADAQGLETLSMRRLAQELGVEAMSLYNHVANKDDLLGGMVEHVARGFRVPCDEDWQAAMRTRCQSAYDVLSRHPWAAGLLLSRVNDGPVVLGYVDATWGCLRKAGFSLAQVDRIWNALDSHVYGFTIQEQKFPFDPGTYQAAAAAYLPMIPQESLPNLHAMTSAVASGTHDGKQDFNFGLDLLLAGIDRLPRET